MVLDLEKIKELIENPLNKKLIEKAVKHHTELERNINGYKIDDYLSRIEGVESKQKEKLRKKLARSNKSIYSEVLGVFDKVFTAKGGSININLSENLKKDFNNKLDNVKNGISIKKWMSNIYKQRLFVDPNGLVFIEHDGEKAYPTYKEITTIHDYAFDGMKIEYVIFYEGKDEDGNKIYRVVDDESDITVTYNGKEIRQIEYLSFFNPWGKVPAILVSDIISSYPYMMDSPASNSIEVGDELLRDNSIKIIYKFLHGYPILWMYENTCSHCGGTGLTKGGGGLCEYCNGQGKTINKDVSEGIGLKLPQADETGIAPNVAGYIQPDLATWEQMNNEIDRLKDELYRAVLDTKRTEEADNTTATGRFIDVQPIYDKLKTVKSTSERAYTFIIDMLGEYYYQGNYKGASIELGSRFQVEGSDELWEKYQKAREKKAPESVLDYHLLEYLQSQFASNDIQLQNQIAITFNEPFTHYSIEEVKKMELPIKDYLSKVYYSEFAYLKDDFYFLQAKKTKIQDDLSKFSDAIIEKLRESESSVDNIQQSALNGAQITSIVGIIKSAALGEIPKESLKPVI